VTHKLRNIDILSLPFAIRTMDLIDSTMLSKVTTAHTTLLQIIIKQILKWSFYVGLLAFVYSVVIIGPIKCWPIYSEMKNLGFSDNKVSRLLTHDG